MSDRVFVASEDDLEPGDRKIVTVNGQSVGVFNFGGTYYAVLNRCPHRGGPVCEGREVTGALAVDWPGPGERETEYYSDAPAVACPWHGWEFDLESGIHLGDTDYRLPTYDVVVDGGDVFVEA
ncbi:MAG: Rieske (2Fe-2S) protein [Halobacteriota archaeon]